jgi:hypothetical protein
MYQFISVRNEEDFWESSKIEYFELFSEHNDVVIQGILWALFGEPLYQTNNYENAYRYVIKATDSYNSSLMFEVYQGSSGCAIGGQCMSVEFNKAITEFKQLLQSTKPADFSYEGYYMDACMKIRCGIHDGRIIFEEDALDDDEIEVMYNELGLR